jgi:E3 ubiquitin-protein ligase RNF213
MPLEVKEIKRVIVFFDEINTNKNVGGLFKEILIDKHVNGRKLNEKIVVIAACNPY